MNRRTDGLVGRSFGPGSAGDSTLAEPYPVAYTRELQRVNDLLCSIAEWNASTGPERGTNRRYALRLLAAERRRRDAARAALHAAATATRLRRAA